MLGSELEAEVGRSRATADAAAREKAAAEHRPLATLDGAFAAYTNAVADRARAEAAEDAAEAKLEAALHALEQKGQAGPSGV